MKDLREVPIFLGFSHRVSSQPAGTMDLLDVGYNLLFPFFPQPLEGIHCVLAFNKNVLFFENRMFHFKLILTDENRPDHSATATGTLTLEQAGTTRPFTDRDREENWGYHLFTMPLPPLVATEPTIVAVDMEWSEERHRIGKFECLFVEPPPILEPERRAIASRPGAARAVCVQIGCNECEGKLRVFTPIDPANQPSMPSEVYLPDAPDQWTCQCGKTLINLTYMKRGLHDLLRRSPMAADRVTRFMPLYEQGQLARIAADFQVLINSDPSEEAVQQFIQQNPVLWAFLSPIKILHKPAVLTKKRADFGILASNKVFYLVELEKPQTRLATKSTGLTADLQKGIEQIKDWAVVVADHRSALLSELSLRTEEVHDIRYLLIAGLAFNTPAEAMIKLKRNPLAKDTQFLCFDDLASILFTIHGQLSQL
jgi:hypothetical protein